MSNRHKGHSIDASYQVSVHLVKWFQGRRFNSDDGRRTPSDDKGLHGLWPGELKHTYKENKTVVLISLNDIRKICTLYIKIV